MNEAEFKQKMEIAGLLVDSLSKKYGAVVAQATELELLVQLKDKQIGLLLERIEALEKGREELPLGEEASEPVAAAE